MAGHPIRPTMLLAPVLVAILYFAFAWLALALTHGVDGIATVWPSSGVLLSALLLSPRRMMPNFLAASAVASGAANMAAGVDLVTALILTLANMTEAALGWWLLRGHGEGQPGFAEPAEIGRFCIAACTTAAASAFVASAGTGGTATFAASWFLTDLLGILIVTPLILMTADAVQGRNPDIALRRPDLVLLLGLVAGMTALVFTQSAYPVLFLPMVALLAAAYRLGPIGAAAGVLLIAAISTTLTANGHGPLMLLHSRGVVPLFLQFYLLVMLGTALPLAAMLATRNRLMRKLRESNRLLQMAERAAQMGHWRMDVATSTLFWSPEVFRLHGLPVGGAPPLSGAIEAYHPDDRARVAAFIASLTAADGGDPDGGGEGGDREFGFEARLVWPDGTVRHVLSRCHRDRAADGTLTGLFGVVQDVSDRVRAAEALEAARAVAEAAADTDELTGLASRRRALRVLDDAIAAARADGRALSVAIFDIDHFKAVNDRFGHQAGDAVLRRVAQAAVAASRRDDLVGRLGGEEFVLLLPGTDAATAMMVAERVRSAIEASGDDAADDAPRVTISIGVARLDGDADTSATLLLNRADRALYDAKRSGRNRLRLAA